MTTTKPLALGIIPMLLHAIHDHAVAHDDQMPRRFELHPAVVGELKAQRDSQRYIEIRDNGDFTFCGILVVPDVLATRAKLITSDNLVEYL